MSSPQSRRDGRALVGAPVVADTTFPEQVVLRLGTAIGIPHPGLGANAWVRPPAGAIKLRFRDLEEGSSSARVPPAPRRISLALPSDPIEGVEGYPMESHGFLDVTLEGGEPVTGLEVEVWGPGVDLLEWTALTGWNPFVDAPDGNPLIWDAPPDPDPADAHRLRFSFPEARLQAADSNFEMLEDDIGARHLRLEATPAGSLVSAGVPSPFDLEGVRLEAIERFIVGAVGSRAELTSLHAHDREDLGG
jgi:hypothetical protein